MAVDPNDDDKQDEKRDAGANENMDDDESAFVPTKRQPKSLLASKSLPTVENALDDFIISANQKLLDVAEFTPETREKALRDEIAELKKKLAAAESKATAVDAPTPSPGGRSWGAIVGAFVVGAGLVFAVGKLTSSHEAARPYAPPAAMDETEPRPQDTPDVADPIAAQPPAVPPVEPPPPVTQPPVTPAATPPVTRPPAVAAKHSPKQPKQPEQPEQPEHAKQPTEPAAGHDGSAAKPPPAQDGSGGDLYNPF
jgi:hypothetical protein